MVRTSDIILIIVAIVFPPAAAAFIAGCSCDLLFSIIFTLCGYIPGHLHAFWLIYRKMEADEEYGRGGYHYVGNGHFEPLVFHVVHSHTHTSPPPSYGATVNA